VTVSSAQSASLPAVKTQFEASGNDSVATVTNLMLADPFNFAGNPDFRPMPGSPLLSGADFSSPTVMDPFFTTTNYRGAMGDTDWTDCWTEWDPINVAYTSSINYGLSPVISTTTSDLQVAFNGTTPNAASYFWDFGDGTTSNEENPTHVYPASGGNYTVSLTVTSARGCTGSATTTVMVVNDTKEVEGLGNVKVYPNPFHSSTTVAFNLKNGMELQVQILDMTGKVVHQFSQEYPSGYNQIQVDGAELNAGVYFLRLMSNEGQKAVKISVVK
jgi:hypothetical protein